MARACFSLKSALIQFFLGVFSLLFAFWLLLSGMYVPVLVSAGVGCSVFVYWLAQRMALIDRESFPFRLAGQTFFSYHALTAKGAAGLAGSKMDRCGTELEGKV